MRKLSYAVQGKVANLKTFAIDEPGHGGACHEYFVGLPASEISPTDGQIVNPVRDKLAYIRFQNGPINVDGNGINGVQNEDLLAILIDRLEGFQSGLYACDENQDALDHCRKALEVLQDRTLARMKRGVEGTHKV